MSKRPCPQCGQEEFDTSLTCGWCGAPMSGTPPQPKFQPKNSPNPTTDWSWSTNKHSYTILMVALAFGSAVGIFQLISANGYSSDNSAPSSHAPIQASRSSSKPPAFDPNKELTQDEIIQNGIKLMQDPEYAKAANEDMQKQKEFNRRMEQYKEDNAWRNR